jgi:DNA modification methylase
MKDCQTVKDIIPNEISDGTILSIVTRDVTPFTHGFHKYPAKFIPQIPRWALQKYVQPNSKQIILDPFCGSGTTLIESGLNGNQSYGIDIDPLSVLISKVKTTKINILILNEIVKKLLENIDKKQSNTFTPECKTLEHWFTTDAIEKLSKIRYLIDKIFVEFGNETEVKDIYDLLMICFSSILRRVSNADNESQKTYVSHTKIKHPEEVNLLFIKQLNYFIERITDFSSNKNLKTPIVFNNSSATSISELLNGQKIDLAITSPPYIKAIDYIYNQMIELFWIGDLFQMQTQILQNEKKTFYIGNKQIPTKEFANYSPFETKFHIDLLDIKLQQVFEADKRNGHKHSYITYKYFTEMEQHFVKISKCLKQNAHYIMVVGDSTVSDIFFDTADILTEIAKRHGLKLTNKWGYKIKSRFMRFDRKGRGGIIDIDWVLDLEKV